MQGVNPAAIRKKKKGEVPMETMKMGEIPSAKTKEQEEMAVIKSAGPSSLPGLKSKGPTANKQPEAEIEIELMLNSAKKKPESKPQDSYTEDLGYFTTGRSGKDGMWKESGESRAKYLRKLKSMKK